MRKVFTVWDSKIQSYLDPFIAINKGEALRIMTDLVNNPNTTFAKYPEDFTLVEIGWYDDSQGEFHMSEKKENLAGLWELKKQHEKNSLQDPKQLDLLSAVRQ